MDTSRERVNSAAVKYGWSVESGSTNTSYRRRDMLVSVYWDQAERVRSAFFTVDDLSGADRITGGVPDIIDTLKIFGW